MRFLKVSIIVLVVSIAIAIPMVANAASDFEQPRSNGAVYLVVNDRMLTVEDKAKIQAEKDEKARIEAERKTELERQEQERIAQEILANEAVYEEYVEYCYEYGYEPTYFSPTTVQEFASQGGVQDSEGRVFTWYSEKALPGNGLTELNENGRHVNEDGLVVDGDGYIAVAHNGVAKGTVVETPYGQGKVYDDGCEGYDIYTSW